MLGASFLFVLVFPSLAAAALARWAAAKGAGMRGVRLLFGGSIENAEAATPWRRAVVAGAALGASYLVAAVVFAGGVLVGGTDVITTEVEVTPGKPAAQAGMQTGDRVVSIGGKPAPAWADVADAVSRHPGEPLEVVVARAGEEKHLTVTPERTAKNKGRIGIVPVHRQEQPGLLSAAWIGLKMPAQVLAAMVETVYSALHSEQEGELMGPGGLVRETQMVARRGAGYVLYFAGALLSYVWPLSAIVSLVSVPRRARPPRKR
jgi:regulator of sigma E protease